MRAMRPGRVGKHFYTISHTLVSIHGTRIDYKLILRGGIHQCMCVSMEHPHVCNASRTRKYTLIYNLTHFGVHTWHAYTLQVNLQRRHTLVHVLTIV